MIKSDGRTAVVTGGASGIGEAVLRRFAEAGWRTISADVDAKRGVPIVDEITRAGADSLFIRVDMAEEKEITALAERFGAVDALINSAGLLQNAVRVLDMDIAEFDRIQAVNVRGTLLAARHFGKAMCARGSGSIVNLCSLTGIRPSAQPAYAMGKASLDMLTQILAAELGPHGVRVNAVAPGYTLTPAMQARIDSGARDPKRVTDNSALGRFVAPREVADAILFLCSDMASAITGVTLPIDCGWLATSAYKSYAAQP